MYESGISPEILDFEEYETESVEETEELEPQVSLPKDETCSHTVEKPAFDFTHIDKLLLKMDTIEAKINWLKNFLKQLQETQKSMVFNSWGNGSSRSIENQYNSVTPYIQTISLGIREVMKKIRLLKEERKRRMNAPSTN